MVVKSSLSGWRVLVTRPENQAAKICDLVLQAGGDFVAFPTIEIKPLDRVHTVNLTEQDMIIFVSRNAVSYFAQNITDEIAGSSVLVSVGKGSAESMRLHGLRVDIQPDQSIGSEGLLLMPEFAEMTGKKVLIIRGKGGRELLADTLVQRGAKVQYIEVYERVLPSPSIVQYENALTANCIVCTSVEGVKNLSVLLQKSITLLLDKPMLVMSERIRDYAMSLGFQNVLVTDTSSDNAVIKQLTKMEIE